MYIHGIFLVYPMYMPSWSISLGYPCISMDIPCISNGVDIPGIYMDIHHDVYPSCIYHVYTMYIHDIGYTWYHQPVPKAYRKCCVKFRTTTSLRTGLIGVIQHSLSEHLKCLKSKTWNDLTSANLFFLERRMRSAAKRVEQSLGYGYLSKMEWFSLRPQLV